ncbi:MAG: hypothetical protein COW89_11375 [Nitrospinae bacterium CG22_combo_CG10-13_8_21_14_all_47_10]|nr:MAG: hypothetical protein COW89_11375 [Nitrospinae bacterium CG22_combo_CG10-13_8_21_14_all_47_10]
MAKLLRLKIKILVFILLGVLLISGCGQSQPSPDLFALPVSYMVGKKPEVVLAHDMNNDEFPDLLVVNSAGNSLNYLEGIGDGTFKNPQTIETGREPFALDVADFNGDRIPDIALCNYGDGNVSIILGQKDGLFKLKTDVKVGRLPIAVKAGDFNNDEKIDLAVTLRFNQMIILLGVGDGTFKVAEAYQAGPTPAYITIDDYNSDGNQDIAMALNEDKVRHIKLFLGNGDGTFKPPEKIAGGNQSSFIIHHDMNLDGKTDLIASSPMRDSLSIYLGDGKGNFSKLEDFAGEKGPHNIVVGDFNGDKFPDIVVCNRREGSISVIQGRGDGTFIYPHFNYVVGSQPRSITGADFNRDGMMDIAVVLYQKQILEVFLSKSHIPMNDA